MDMGKMKITCIPNNEEKYISFSKIITVDQYKDEKNVQTQSAIRGTLFHMGFEGYAWGMPGALWVPPTLFACAGDGHSSFGSWKIRFNMDIILNMCHRASLRP